jgi:hypothetical protein
MARDTGRVHTRKIAQGCCRSFLKPVLFAFGLCSGGRRYLERWSRRSSVSSQDRLVRRAGSSTAAVETVSQGSRDEDENGNDDEWELTTALRGRYAESAVKLSSMATRKKKEYEVLCSDWELVRMIFQYFVPIHS